MKITLIGAAGNITKPLAENLLTIGHTVSVIGRNAETLKSLRDKGAIVKIGNIEDADFIKSAFQDAEVVYTMIPPPYDKQEWIDYAYNIAKNYAQAIVENKVRKVVNLSTYGAHRNEGTGPINSIAQLEKALNELQGIAIIHLRAGYFYSNFFSQIQGLKQMGVIGSNYDGNFNIPFVHTNDIANVAFRAITTSELDSKSPYYVVSEIATFNEAATQLGKAIGKNVSWQRFTDEQLEGGLHQAGFPSSLIEKLVEFGQQLQSGILTEHYFSLPTKPVLGKTKLEDFSKEFAVVYNAN
jgi:uncharacterized protein YbjT (DUF2867 family)